VAESFCPYGCCKMDECKWAGGLCGDGGEGEDSRVGACVALFWREGSWQVIW
jgi:hypothetical protein